MGNGTKFDQGKLRMAEMLLDFKEPLEKVCEVWEYGAEIHGESNWKQLDNPIVRYTNAMVRHMMAEKYDPVDNESLKLHAAHIAWNALARLYFIIEGGRPTLPFCHPDIYKKKPSAPDYRQLKLDLDMPGIGTANTIQREHPGLDIPTAPSHTEEYTPSMRYEYGVRQGD